MPEDVTFIIETLKNNGHEAYIVGGCVRDALLEKEPTDWDITTSAKPMEVKKLFRRTIDTGIAHGTVTVLLHHVGYEVTTYRIDGEYEDCRRPKEVIFTGNLLEDLKRRDFTINAMAYNEVEGLIDAFHGKEDLDEGIIRCVGDAKERFREDALRMLRAIRFAGQLDFDIAKETAEGIRELAVNLAAISPERIQVELVKLLISNRPDKLLLGYELGITKIILPEFDSMMKTPQNHKHHDYSVGEHTIKSVGYVEADKILRLTMLLHDTGKPFTKTTDKNGVDHFYNHHKKSKEIAKKVLERLNFDNHTMNYVTRLVFWHDYRPEKSLKGVRKGIYKVGQDIFPYLFEVKKADILSQSMYKRESKLEALEEYQRLYEEIIAKQDCISLKMLAVNGKDLIDMGIEQGVELGETLNQLLLAVIEDPELNTKETLIKMAEEISGKN